MSEDAYYKHFENRKCEYYPCHKNVKIINCLFCFCPLYRIPDCGGGYIILANGIKDCSNCMLPHGPAGYDIIVRKLIEANKGVET